MRNLTLFTSVTIFYYFYLPYYYFNLRNGSCRYSDELDFQDEEGDNSGSKSDSFISNVNTDDLSRKMKAMKTDGVVIQHR